MLQWSNLCRICKRSSKSNNGQESHNNSRSKKPPFNPFSTETGFPPRLIQVVCHQNRGRVFIVVGFPEQEVW